MSQSIYVACGCFDEALARVEYYARAGRPVVIVDHSGIEPGAPWAVLDVRSAQDAGFSCLECGSVRKLNDNWHCQDCSGSDGK